MGNWRWLFCSLSSDEKDFIKGVIKDLSKGDRDMPQVEKMPDCRIMKSGEKILVSVPIMGYEWVSLRMLR